MDRHHGGRHHRPFSPRGQKPATQGRRQGADAPSASHRPQSLRRAASPQVESALMAEAARAPLPSDKAARYVALRAEIAAVISGEPSRIARYASAASLLAEAFPDRFFWTGFYLIDETKTGELVVGPYQGTLGCLRIPIGKGVCG